MLKMLRHAFTALCIIGCAAGFAPSVGSARAAACAPLRMAGFGASVKTKKPKPAAASGPGIGKGQGPLEKQWNTFAELRDADGAAFHDVWARPAGSEGAWKKAGRVACANGASADEAVSAQFVLIGWSALEIYRLAWADAGAKAAELAHAPCDASAVSDALEAEAADFATLAPSAPLAPAPKVAVGNVRAADIGFKPVRSPLAKDGELTHATKSEKRLGKGKKAGGAPVGAADSKGRL